MPTYKTRHMTARENLLVDALAADRRYAKVAERLRPTPPKPKAKAKAEAEPAEDQTIGKPKPKNPAR